MRLIDDISPMILRLLMIMLDMFTSPKCWTRLFMKTSMFSVQHEVSKTMFKYLGTRSRGYLP